MKKEILLSHNLHITVNMFLKMFLRMEQEIIDGIFAARVAF